MIIFHKYYLFNLLNGSINNINSKDFSLLCISCFLIGIKSSDILIRIDDILECIYKNKILKIDNNLLETHKKIIFNYEFEILESLGFDINSYNLNLKYISCIFDNINNKIKIESDVAKIKKIKEYLIAQIRYSFILPIFLKFNILTIVLSNIIMIIKQLSINFEIKTILCELKGNEEITLQDIDDFIKLFEFFLVSQKDNNNNEINDFKNINMDTIRKINIANSDNTKDCLNIINDNKNINNL